MCSSKKATLPTRVSSSLHFKRKIQHFGSGLVLLAIDLSNVMTPFQEAAVVFFCACAFLAAIHLTPRKTFVSIFKDILRAEEASGKVYPATLWFLLGCVTLLLLFPTHPDIYRPSRVAIISYASGSKVAFHQKYLQQYLIPELHVDFIFKSLEQARPSTGIDNWMAHFNGNVNFIQCMAMF